MRCSSPPRAALSSQRAPVIVVARSRPGGTPMDLEQRIARLEAIEEIKQLKAQYAQVCDDGYKPEGMVPLFTEDAVWADSSGGLGRHEGREAGCARICRGAQ